MEKRGAKCNIELVEKAGHHMYLDNPEGTLRAIVSGVMGDDLPPCKEPSAKEEETSAFGAEEVK